MRNAHVVFMLIERGDYTGQIGFQTEGATGLFQKQKNFGYSLTRVPALKLYTQSQQQTIATNSRYEIQSRLGAVETLHLKRERD